MKYKLIIFDIDGTITTHVSSWRFIHERLKLWTNRAFRYQEDFFAGKISYRRFCELDAAHWKGMPEARIRRLFDSTRYSKNAVKCVRKLKAAGLKLVAISTGLQFMTDRVRDELGFDYAISNRLLSRKGILTGGVHINLEHGAKHKILKRIFKKFGVRPSETISVGDSEGDMPLAKECGYSIAFNSSCEELSRIVDYDCRTRDFREIFNKITQIYE